MEDAAPSSGHVPVAKDDVLGADIMNLYCQCGHPIVVTATWVGDDISIKLHDGNIGDMRDDILACPHCGSGVNLGELRPRPPRTAHWFVRDNEDDLSERTG
jgi:hypothetical protein